MIVKFRSIFNIKNYIYLYEYNNVAPLYQNHTSHGHMTVQPLNLSSPEQWSLTTTTRALRYMDPTCMCVPPPPPFHSLYILHSLHHPLHPLSPSFLPPSLFHKEQTN